MTGLHENLNAAFDWWRAAGVDYSYSDAPQNWITPPAPTPEASPTTAPAPKLAAKPQAVFGGDPGHWATDHAGFVAWWLSEPSLDNGQVNRRVAPRGPIGAKLMVLVPEPELVDSDVLLSGPQGKWLKMLLFAWGIGEDETYVASALPRHTPMADWDGLAAAGLGTLVGHHIGLAAPQRLLVLGNCILPLAAHDPAKKAFDSGVFEHKGLHIPRMAAPEPLSMRPPARERLWLEWLERSQNEPEQNEPK